MTFAPEATRYKLETRGLAKRFRLPVLDDLSLGVAPGELLCLLGPNGYGKTTLLRILAGLEAPDAGSVLVDGHVLAPRARRQTVGVVFQEPRLLPWRTVRENVTLCLKPLGLTGVAAAGRRPLPGPGRSARLRGVLPRSPLGRDAAARRRSPGRWPSSRRSC